MSIVKMENVIATVYDALRWETIPNGQLASIAYPAFERILMRDRVVTTPQTAQTKWKLLVYSEYARSYNPKQNRVYVDIKGIRDFLDETGATYIPYTAPKSAKNVCVCVSADKTGAKE